MAVASSPEMAALFEEFRALRSELTTRIEKQQDITNFAIAILVGLLAVAKVIDGRTTASDSILQARVFFPWISIILSSFTLMVLDHEMNIAHLTIYIHNKLRPRVEAALFVTSTLWEWNSYRAQWQQHAGVLTTLTTPMAGAKYVVTVFPNLLLTVAYWYTRPPSAISVNWAWTTYLVSVALLVLVILAAGYTSRAYLSMEYKAHTESGEPVAR